MRADYAPGVGGKNTAPSWRHVKRKQSEPCVLMLWWRLILGGPWACNGQFQLRNELYNTGPVFKSRKSKKSSFFKTALGTVSQCSRRRQLMENGEMCPSPLFCCYHHWGAAAPEAHVWPRGEMPCLPSLGLKRVESTKQKDSHSRKFPKPED